MVSMILGFLHNYKSLFSRSRQGRNTCLPQLMASVILVGFLAIKSIQTVHASSVSGSPFQVTLPVDDRTKDKRQEVFAKGMRHLLYSLSGDKAVFADAEITKLLNNAIDYINSYSYVNIPASDISRFSSSFSGQRGNQLPPQLGLQIDFDPKTITRLLIKQGYPAWINSRPNVLIWFAMPNASQDLPFLSDNSTSPIKRNLIAAFSRLNIPVIFPLMDLQDISALRRNSSDQNVILQASKRYATPAVLIVQASHVNKENNLPESTASFIFQGNTFQQSLFTLSPATIAETLASFVITPMAQFYAKTQEQDTNYEFTFEVRNINSLKDFASVEKYLKKNPLIKQIIPEEIKPGVVSFHIQASADIVRITNFFNIDQQLLPVLVLREDNEGASIELKQNTPYVFQWQA